MIEIRYFSAFYFYFCKSINEILANISVPNQIKYKDVVFDDSEHEYLEKYYSNQEIFLKKDELMRIYKNYLSGFPNLITVD